MTGHARPSIYLVIHKVNRRRCGLLANVTVANSNFVDKLLQKWQHRATSHTATDHATSSVAISRTYAVHATRPKWNRHLLCLREDVLSSSSK